MTGQDAHSPDLTVSDLGTFFDQIKPLGYYTGNKREDNADRFSAKSRLQEKEDGRGNH